MGFVFKARQPKLDRFVALKILPQTLAADPAFAERFTREGRVLARLNHPNIVTIHDFGQANGFFYLLMEFVDGVNLRQAMKAGRFTPAQALAVVPKICEALQFAHSEGILHRDIKPENILLDTKGRVKIADFGIAKLVGAELASRSAGLRPGAIAADGPEAPGRRPALQNLTETGKVLGTLHYMAPEQLEKPGDVDHRADIYSLGVVFYEMLTGELPIGRFAPPSEKSGADPRLDDVVLHTLEKERERRTQSAGEVKTQVETIANDTAGAGSSAGSAREPRSDARSSAVIYARKKTKSEFLGTGCAVQAIGVACFFIPVVGFVLGIVLLIVGGRMALRLVCSHCGSRAAEDAQTCAHCGAHFEQYPSRLARLGAAWTGLALLAAGVVILFGLKEQGSGKLLLLLSLTAPFGTTILGWIAVAQIRRSAGRLYGLGLAVFDGLLFPLLTLDALIAVAFKFLGAAIVLDFGLPHNARLSSLLVAMVLAIVLVDWLIIRAVWRAVNRPPAAATPAPAQQRRRFWPRFALVSALLTLAIAALVVAPNFIRSRGPKIISGQQFLSVGAAGNRAVLGGYAYAGARIAFSVGNSSDGWSCKFPDSTPFTATLEKGLQGLNCRVAAADGRTLLSIGEATQLGDVVLNEGTLVFRSARPPENRPDGNCVVTIGYWIPKSGQSIPLKVALSAPPEVAPTQASAAGPSITPETEPGRPARPLAAAPFLGRLAQGGIELVAIGTGSSSYPATNTTTTWWLPDGAPAADPRYEWSGSGFHGDDPALYRQLVLRSVDLPPTASRLQLEQTEPSGDRITSEAARDGRPVPGTVMVSLKLPTNAPTLNLRVGVATGPWVENRGLTSFLNGHGMIRFSHGHDSWKAAIQNIEEVGGDTRVVAYHTALAGWQAELVLVDSAGKEWFPTGRSESGEGLCHLTGICSGLKLSQIKEIYFRIRPYQYVEFRNVSLQPGMRTRLEIVDATNP